MICCCLAFEILEAHGHPGRKLPTHTSVVRDTIIPVKPSVPVMPAAEDTIFPTFPVIPVVPIVPTIPGDTVVPGDVILEGDTIPVSKKYSNSWFGRMRVYRDSLRSKQYRDSLIRKVTRQDVPEPPVTDSSIIKSELYFKPYSGKVIRDVYFRRVNVFGPSNIKDTTFSTSMKLVNLANRLHFNTEEWVIRQQLFFRENDTLNPYEMSDNERYLRSRPFIQDARLYIINTGASEDSIDLLVVTKDVFEYGFDLSRLSTSGIRASVSNDNLFGAGQGVRIGGSWSGNDNPPFGSQARYTKNNILGSFIDFSGGYTTLNNFNTLDSGTYEGSYYFAFDRPLYKSGAKWLGGVSFSTNYSINMFNRSDTLYRDYQYNVLDIWGGYNILKQDSRNPGSRRPNVALLVRHFNLLFTKRPTQEQYKLDPLYNNHRYYLAQAVVFRQEFFKTHHFFGFGRTEDIPLGYTASATAGWDTWKGRTRGYVGVEGEKFWVTRGKGIIYGQAGLSTFYQNFVAEDAVIHAKLEYYSRAFRFGRGLLRQFLYFDYLGNLNRYFYRPLNINREVGVWGYRDVPLSGYQRLNLRTETIYYSPLKILGFKFNFFTSIQASQLSFQSNNLLKNPVYTGLGLGVRVKNENLSLNTMRFSANYYPNAAHPMRSFFWEATTTVDFRFNIFSLRAPAFLQFR
ncbi:BamA/TamA family outer membrane protein [Chitinophaga rhizophila]|uniref:Outer membrane protein/protective antigen OMA87 n=1 Tax=Chitinophaga rhizophila TaxID=2866212 RepID=A0ABS7GGV1_9BACT|nr:hypothetical protein [Chitinophaga rhizophila]MBW8686919.1 hypothetical protein [Chitinophaga rhizophila]